MSCQTIDLPPTPTAPLSLGAAVSRAPRLLWLVVAILLSWAVEAGVYAAFEPPGAALRHELTAAAAVLQVPVTLQSTPALAQAVGRPFRTRDATIDTHRLWPIVAVTVHGLSREACLDALHDTRRINGNVVIALQGYGSSTDCAVENDMTWWLMP
jgi:hypothetical protein